MNRSLGVGLLIGVLVGVLVLGGAPVADAGPSDRGPETDADDPGGTASGVGQLSDVSSEAVQSGESPELTQQSDQTGEPDHVEFRITVHENGTAVWTFTYEHRFDNASEREQFESFAQEFEQNESHPLYEGFHSQATSLVTAGANQTGREMTARAFSRDARVEQQFNEKGVVTMSFHWTNFAQQDGERLIVGDVFEGGLFISGDQWLVVERGDGLAFTEVDPHGEFSNETLETSDSVTWVGPQEFTDNRPRVVLAPEGTVDAPDQTETAPATDDSDTWMLLAGVIVLMLGIGSAVAWRSGGAIIPRPGDESGGEAVDDVGSDAAETAPETDVADDPAVPEEELMTDEDRVKSLLEENGGRMKQVNIVEETGWSKSKVSMLLSDMEEEGDISKLRVGRENIISLDGHEPEAAGSPFENED